MARLRNIRVMSGASGNKASAAASSSSAAAAATASSDAEEVVDEQDTGDSDEDSDEEEGYSTCIFSPQAHPRRTGKRYWWSVQHGGKGTAASALPSVSSSTCIFSNALRTLSGYTPSGVNLIPTPITRLTPHLSHLPLLSASWPPNPQTSHQWPWRPRRPRRPRPR